jgi:hemolysin activation/secretion protein
MFRNTGAQGKAATLGVDLGYPLLRSTSANLSLRAGLEHKRLRDDLVAILESTQKRNDVGELTAAFDFRNPLDGLAAGSATVSVGQLRTAGQQRHEWATPRDIHTAHDAGPPSRRGTRRAVPLN